MLQFIREKSQGVIAIVIFGIIALSFALWGIHNYFMGNANQAAVVSVNGDKITQQQLNSALQRAQAQARSMGMAINTQAQVDALKQHVLQGLIYNNLLQQSAKENHFAVSPTLIEVTLAKLPAFQENGVFSKPRFLRMMEAMGYTQQQFMQSLSDSLLLQQVQSGMSETAFSLPYQVNQALSLIKQTRSFSYFVIPSKDFKSQVHVTDADVQKYYQSHQQAFTIPQKVSVNYLTVSLADLEKNIHPTDQQLQSFYQSNINLFSASKAWKIERIQVPLAQDASDNQIKAAHKKIDGIYSEMKKGTSFADLAKANPPQNEVGHNGWVSLLEVPRATQLQLIMLKKTGAVSKPFQSDQGFEIVKVDAIKPAKVHPYSQVSGRVKKLYVQQAAQKLYSNATDKLANLTFEHPNTLDSAAKALNLPVQTSPLFSRAGGKDLFENAQILNAAFSNDVLNNGNNSDLVNVNDTEAVVLRMAKKVPATVKPLTDVSAGIKKQLEQNQASLKAQSLALQALRTVKSKADLEKAAAAHGYKVVNESNIVRNKMPKGVSTALVRSMFNLPVPANANQLPSSVMTLAGGDYAVAVLTKVTNADAAKVSDSEKEAFANANTVSQGNLDYALYMKGLFNNAKIKHYQQQTPQGAQG